MTERETDILTIEEEYIPDFFEENEADYTIESAPEYQSNSVVRKQIQRFDDYSHESQQEEYQEYEVIKSYAPKVKKKTNKENKEFNSFIENQYAYTPANETYIYQRSKTKNTLSNRTKGRILVYCFACIAILLSSLCIINVVNMTTINLQNAQTQTEISGIDKDLTNLENSIEDIEDEIKNQANQSSFSPITPENTESITLLQKNEVQNYSEPTNFFDSICNFISGMFGG